MNGRTQSFVLLLFGAALLRLATTQALLRFVRPVSRPWVLLAGAAIAILAISSLLAPRRADCGVDGHVHVEAPRVTWLIVAPVVAILVLAPPALGSYSAAREPVNIARSGRVNFPALPTPDPAPLSLSDFATRAIWDNGRTLAGRTVRLTGFVLRGGEAGFVLSRLVITCCAADARPVDVTIIADDPPRAVGSWLTVTGRYAGASRHDPNMPMLEATRVLAISEPSNPYDN